MHAQTLPIVALATWGLALLAAPTPLATVTAALAVTTTTAALIERARTDANELIAYGAHVEAGRQPRT